MEHHAMGEVYKARDTRLDRIVAIKTSKKQFTERFERAASPNCALAVRMATKCAQPENVIGNACMMAEDDAIDVRDLPSRCGGICLRKARGMKRRSPWRQWSTATQARCWNGWAAIKCRLREPGEEAAAEADRGAGRQG